MVEFVKEPRKMTKTQTRYIAMLESRLRDLGQGEWLESIQEVFVPSGWTGVKRAAAAERARQYWEGLTPEERGRRRAATAKGVRRSWKDPEVRGRRKAAQKRLHAERVEGKVAVSGAQAVKLRELGIWPEAEAGQGQSGSESAPQPPPTNPWLQHDCRDIVDITEHEAMMLGLARDAQDRQNRIERLRENRRRGLKLFA